MPGQDGPYHHPERVTRHEGSRSYDHAQRDPRHGTTTHHARRSVATRSAGNSIATRSAGNSIATRYARRAVALRHAGHGIAMRRVRRWIAMAICCALAVSALMPGTSANAQAHRPTTAAAHKATAVFAGSKRMSRSVRMQERFAEWSLRSNGIGWRSNGRCHDRRRTDCTSFEGMRWGSIDGLIDFKEDSGCHLTVSGGTENGHAKGRYSHSNGYKIDVMPTRCTDHHITHAYRHTGVRGDGAQLYRSPEDVTFARENSHWDILFH
ncbi:hypothetical protein J4573_51445 [Actinomadura barringtoniae]|uniref:Uncharacterized protein n=1 Tax=Actinomadura barringtoniae TaxID=1427535 RepID=A0A939TDG8_9ACTN|nr:hypothetical protein [Actinomadura barringtoniae]MBO2455572.1 hypothetical protein [Actinomadura barringtoniae]